MECEDITCGRGVSVNGSGARVIDSFVRNKEIGEVCFAITIMALYVTPEAITIVVVGISDRERRDGKRNEEEVRREECVDQDRSRCLSGERETEEKRT